jgi:quercetin dioxygenase-like cupin family protein
MLRLNKQLFLSLVLASTTTGLAMAKSSVTEPVVIKEVLSATKAWDGSNLPGFNTGTPELKVLTYKIASGAKTSVHIHTINGAGYMLAGELTMYATEDSKGSFADASKVKKVQLKAGDAWTEAVNVWHYGENNGQDDVTFVLVFAGDKGTQPTLSAPVK